MVKKIKIYSEAELIQLFDLNRLLGNEQHPTIKYWTNVADPLLSIGETEWFEQILEDAQKNLVGWQEEDLKMNFISFVLRLGHLRSNKYFNVYCEKTLTATVKGYPLKTKTDFMIAKGIWDKPEHPYFHFQEWKPHKKPTGDSMAQLLEAFLIAQSINQDNETLYGCEVTGEYWRFVIFEGNTYCISNAYDSTKREDLLQIIAILRKFKAILEGRLQAI